MNKKRKSQSPKPVTVSVGLQKTFIAAVVITFGFQLVINLYYIISQHLKGVSNHGMPWLLTSGALLPFTFFVIAYMLSPRKKQRIHLIFESLLIGVIGVFGMTLLSQIANYIYMKLVTAGSGYEQYLAYEMAAAAISLGIYCFTLVHLRENKRWK